MNLNATQLKVIEQSQKLIAISNPELASATCHELSRTLASEMSEPSVNPIANLLQARAEILDSIPTNLSSRGGDFVDFGPDPGYIDPLLHTLSNNGIEHLDQMSKKMKQVTPEHSLNFLGRSRSAITASELESAITGDEASDAKERFVGLIREIVSNSQAFRTPNRTLRNFIIGLSNALGSTANPHEELIKSILAVSQPQEEGSNAAELVSSIVDPREALDKPKEFFEKLINFIDASSLEVEKGSKLVTLAMQVFLSDLTDFNSKVKSSAG